MSVNIGGEGMNDIRWRCKKRRNYIMCRSKYKHLHAHLKVRVKESTSKGRVFGQSLATTVREMMTRVMVDN